MDIQRDELLLREEARAAADAVTHPVQSRQAIDAIALEVVTHGIGVNLQDFRHFLSAVQPVASATTALMRSASRLSCVPRCAARSSSSYSDDRV